MASNIGLDINLILVELHVAINVLDVKLVDTFLHVLNPFVALDDFK